MIRSIRALAAGLIASMWLLVAAVMPVAAQNFGEGQPNPCDFMIPFDPDVRYIGNSVGEGGCTAGMIIEDGQGGARSHSLDVYRRLTPADALDLAAQLADARPATAEYGGQAFEGSDSYQQFRIVFVIHNYVGVAASWDEDADTARANAAQLYGAMAAQIGPPQAAASLTPTPVASRSASPSGTPGPMSLGLGCGTDERFVRCTASVYDARPDADLVFTWRFDGSARPETGSTMELNWLLEGVSEGSHTVGVDVRDARNNVGPAATSTGFVLGQVSPPADGAGTDDAVQAAIAGAVATAVGVGVAAALGKGPAAQMAPETGNDPFTDAADLLANEANTRVPGASLLPKGWDYPGWRQLLNWPPGSPDDAILEAYKLCVLGSGKPNTDPGGGGPLTADRIMACMRGQAASAWASMPKPPPPEATPEAAAVDALAGDAGTPPPGDTAAWLNFANWPPEAPDWFADSWQGCMQKSAGEVNQTFIDCLRAAADEARDYLDRNRDSIAPLAGAPPAPTAEPTKPGPGPAPSPTPDPDKSGLDKIMDDLSK